jgi:hypothetical protein
VVPHGIEHVGRRRADIAAPLTAAALIAQQVAANAIRDALFLTWFPVTSLSIFVSASAILTVTAVALSGRLLRRFRPTGVVPALLGFFVPGPWRGICSRGAATVRADLLNAAATMAMSRGQLRHHLAAPDLDEEAEA